MRPITILSLPIIAFAHVYESEYYENDLDPRENLLEITYIAEGELQIQRGSRIDCAKKGDIVIFLRDKHSRVIATEKHCHHTVGAVVRWKYEDQEQNALLLPLVIPIENETTSIYHMIDGFVQKQTSYKTNRVKGAAKFLELLCEIDRCYRKKMQPQLPSEILYAEKAKQYLQKNIKSEITQKAVAEYLGISSGYLCNVFKKTEGITFMRYVNQEKLERIKSLMEIEKVRLYQAAAMYGYSDPNYVSRLFKRYYGYNITDKPKKYMLSDQK